jgi:hypothetical protein
MLLGKLSTIAVGDGFISASGLSTKINKINKELSDAK